METTAYVISVGVINMTTGMTSFAKDQFGHKPEGWSVYENKGLFAYLTSGDYLLLATENTFQKGDVVTLVGNDSNRKLGKVHTIVDSAPCDKEVLLDMLKKNNFDYYPIRAYTKRPAGNKKLGTSFSVKGNE